MTQMRAPHFKVVQNQRFLEEKFELKLVPEAKQLFDEGAPGQGYIGLVDVETGEIYLVPSFNKDDGLLRLNKAGKEFKAQRGAQTINFSMESQATLGTVGTGDLHRNCAILLGLAHKGAQHAGLLGFGLWKGGACVKIVKERPNLNALVPDEFLLFQAADKNWKLEHSEYDAKGRLITVDIPLQEIPGLAEQLESKDLNTFAGRQKLTELITKAKPSSAEMEKIKFIKNRSTQNSWSCKYSEFYRAFFDIFMSSQSAHQLNLPREIPLLPFKKIVQAIFKKLDIKPHADFLKEPALASDRIYGILGHLEAESNWMNFREEESLEYACAKVLESVGPNSLDKSLLVRLIELAGDTSAKFMQKMIVDALAESVQMEPDLAVGKKCFDCLAAICTLQELDKTVADVCKTAESPKQAKFVSALFACWRAAVIDTSEALAANGKPKLKNASPNYDELSAAGIPLLFLVLALAADDSDMESFLKAFLKLGVNTDCVDASGTAAVLYAAKQNDWMAVQTLLEHKANPQVSNAEGSLLEFAMRTERLDYVQMVIRYGAHPYDEKAQLKPAEFFKSLVEMGKGFGFPSHNILRETIKPLFESTSDEIKLKLIISLLELLKTSLSKESDHFVFSWVCDAVCRFSSLKGGTMVPDQVAKAMSADEKMTAAVLRDTEILGKFFKMTAACKSESLKQVLIAAVKADKECQRAIDSGWKLSVAFAEMTQVKQAQGLPSSPVHTQRAGTPPVDPSAVVSQVGEHKKELKKPS